MKLRLLSLEETKRIYDRYMVRDFPPAERKPFASIRQLMEAGLYEPLGAEAENGRLLAYAWQTVVPGCASALLDYFAVLPEGRGRGTGTAVLRALAARDAPHRDSLIIECEHPAEAPDPAAALPELCNALRRRRARCRHQRRPAGHLPGHGARTLLPGQCNILRRIREQWDQNDEKEVFP